MPNTIFAPNGTAGNWSVMSRARLDDCFHTRGAFNALSLVFEIILTRCCVHVYTTLVSFKALHYIFINPNSTCFHHTARTLFLLPSYKITQHLFVPSLLLLANKTKRHTLGSLVLFAYSQSLDIDLSTIPPQHPPFFFAPRAPRTLLHFINYYLAHTSSAGYY